MANAWAMSTDGTGTIAVTISRDLNAADLKFPTTGKGHPIEFRFREYDQIFDRQHHSELL